MRELESDRYKQERSIHNSSLDFSATYNDAIADLNPEKWTAVYGEKIVGTSTSREGLIQKLTNQGLEPRAAVMRVFRKRPPSK